jgi:hypothetical protein
MAADVPNEADEVANTYQLPPSPVTAIRPSDEATPGLGLDWYFQGHVNRR